MKICNTLTCPQCRWEARYWRVTVFKRVVIEHQDLLDKHGILHVDDYAYLVDDDEEED